MDDKTDKVCDGRYYIIKKELLDLKLELKSLKQDIRSIKSQLWEITYSLKQYKR